MEQENKEIECPSCGHTFQGPNPLMAPDENEGQEQAETEAAKPNLSFTDALKKRKGSR